MKFNTGILNFDQKIKHFLSGDVSSYYGQKDDGKTLFLLELALRIQKTNPQLEINYFTNESSISVMKKIISNIEFESIDKLDGLSDIKIINKFKILKKNNAFMQNFNIIETNTSKESLIKQLEKYFKNTSYKKHPLLFIDNIDKHINNFTRNGKDLLSKIKRIHNNLTIFFSYSTGSIGDWIDECSENLSFRINNKNRVIEVESLSQYIDPISLRRENLNIYGFEFRQKVFSQKRCNCGGSSLKYKYGNDVMKFSRYHSHYCDLYPSLID